MKVSGYVLLTGSVDFDLPDGTDLGPVDGETDEEFSERIAGLIDWKGMIEQLVDVEFENLVEV